MADTMSELLEAVRKHSGMDDEQIREAGEFGADAGWPGFTHTTDCVEFYEQNERLILDVASEMALELGCKNVAEMVAGFGRADMLDIEGGWANLLAWFALEEAGRYLGG